MSSLFVVFAEWSWDVFDRPGSQVEVPVLGPVFGDPCSK